MAKSAMFPVPAPFAGENGIDGMAMNSRGEVYVLVGSNQEEGVILDRNGSSKGHFSRLCYCDETFVDNPKPVQHIYCVGD